MEAIFAATILLAFIALGELVSIWSKARIPSLLVAMLGVFIFAKLGIVPESVVDDSMLVQIYTILVAPRSSTWARSSRRGSCSSSGAR